MNVPAPHIEQLRQRLDEDAAQAMGSTDSAAAYVDVLGFAPPCAARKSADGMAPLLQRMHERMRVGGLMPGRLEPRTSHLLLLGMLLMEHGAEACAQAVAARRAGASWDDLRDVVHLAFLLHGLPAAHRGEELLAALAQWEHDDKIAGAVAAYG